jgi:putative ABC transport system permease protein
VKALARKGWRDLWHLRGQVVAVALVAAVGVANLVMSRATLQSLEASRARYYREQAFADVFADLERAPEQLARRLRGIPGVVAVETRVVAHGRAEVAGFGDPIRVQAVSTPEPGGQRLNRLHLRAGRAPGDGERDALVVSDAFAEAHGLRPGDTLPLVLHGRRQAFRIAGIGGSPEFVAQLSPQAVFPDPRRYAIVWLPRRSLEAAMDLDGAFNSVALALGPGAGEARVIAAVDRILAPHGGVGAIGRQDQRSHRYLEEEFRQLRTMARLFPAVFLGVAAFVLHVVLGRLVGGQREQIGTLKAFGYDSREIWRHYAGLAVVIGCLGAALGLALGVELGRLLAGIYRTFYRLPYLDFRLSPGVAWLALAVSLGSAVAGAAVPVFRAARLPPAEAMRPDVPGQGPLRRAARLRGTRRLSQAHRLILRNLLRRPLRTLLTWVGLALGTAVMMMGRFQNDAVDHMVERQYERAERHDVSVAFVEPVSPRALAELASLPGVVAVEPQRTVPVRVRHRAADHRTVLVGLAVDARLRRTLDARGEPIRPPPHGVLLTDYLAGMLGVRAGDRIELETLEGRRRMLRLPVAGVVDEPFGVQAYAPLEAMDRLLGDGERIDAAVLAVDAVAMPRLLAELERRPAIAAVGQRRAGIRNFYDSLARTILTYTLIATVFGMVITAGVVYSSARVALSERARDLASLRVLGFTAAETGYLLLGELALLTVLAIPLGFALGNGLVALLVLGYDSDLFRIPHHVSATTYAVAGLATLLTAVACGIAIHRRVGRLDLIGVLKARD